MTHWMKKVAIAALTFVDLFGCTQTTDELVGTWRATLVLEKGKSALNIPIEWKLSADGTADYGSTPDNRGKWTVVRREGKKRIVRVELRGVVTEQTIVIEGPDEITLIGEVDESGQALKPVQESGRGLTFRRARSSKK
jgi:hypothetical protein